MADPNYVILDFETRSPCPIEHGADNYAAHPDTEVLCLGFRTEDMDRAHYWVPGQPVDLRLANALQLAADGKAYAVAHNATFDRLVYEYICTTDYGFPVLPLSSWYCSSAEARANALPGGLDKALRAALNDPQARGKDHRGGVLIRECCIPPYNEDPQLLVELIQYCMRDVDATAELLELTCPLNDTHVREYHVNEKINDRGIRVDTELAQLCCNYAEAEANEIALRLEKLTSGAVTKHTQSQRMRVFILEKLNEDIGWSRDDKTAAAVMREAMVTYKDGKKKWTLDKATRAELMAIDDEHHVFASEVREALELYDGANASSVAKFKRMVDMASDAGDGKGARVRGAFLFAGAGQTLRFSSKGLQLHNFRRDCFKPAEVEAIKAAMQAGAPANRIMTVAGQVGGNMMQVLAKLLRPAIIPADGHTLVVYDWSAIEARVLPWLSGSHPTAVQLLELFRSGEDVYIHTAAGIYGVEVGLIAGDQRQVGKVAVLSLGFGGSVGALGAMARNYGMVLDGATKQRTVDRWRATNPWAVEFWGALMTAFRRAWRNEGTSYKAGRVSYIRRGPHVYACLPCGSELCYPFVQPDEDGYTYAKGALTPKAAAKQWPRARLWHGVLAENVTQAVAASLLRWLLDRITAWALPVVGHTHDEVILEVPDDRESVRSCEEVVSNLMSQGPSWAAGLPLAAEGGAMVRYGK